MVKLNLELMILRIHILEIVAQMEL